MTDSSSAYVTRSPGSSRGLRAATLAFAALAGAVITGCPGTLQDPERFLGDGAAGGGSCPDVETTIIQGTCAVGGCHSTADKQQGLDLQSPNPASRLVNVPATEGTGLLIDPNAPQTSILYVKLSATPPFGARMPFGQTPLDAATIACVLDWITAQVQVDAGSDDGSQPPSGDDGSEPASGDDATTGSSDASGMMMSGMDATTTPPKDAGATMDAHVRRDAGMTMDATSSPPEASAPGDDGSDDAPTD